MPSPSDVVFPSSNPDSAKGAADRYRAGLTLRQHIIIEIAAALTASPMIVTFDDDHAWLRLTPQQIADSAAQIADAVITKL